MHTSDSKLTYSWSAIFAVVFLWALSDNRYRKAKGEMFVEVADVSSVAGFSSAGSGLKGGYSAKRLL
jgi:hypothetical protein